MDQKLCKLFATVCIVNSKLQKPEPTQVTTVFDTGGFGEFGEFNHCTGNFNRTLPAGQSY